MKHPMKYKLFSELQRKDLDLFMFHEHGMPTGQLINDELACTDFNNRYKMLKSTLYNAVMAHVGKRDKDTLRIQMQEKRQVNEVIFLKTWTILSSGKQTLFTTLMNVS